MYTIGRELWYKPGTIVWAIGYFKIYNQGGKIIDWQYCINNILIPNKYLSRKK